MDFTLQGMGPPPALAYVRYTLCLSHPDRVHRLQVRQLARRNRRVSRTSTSRGHKYLRLDGRHHTHLVANRDGLGVHVLGRTSKGERFYAE
jgi:hypothetical protein